jgi:hypothetical protein
MKPEQLPIIGRLFGRKAQGRSDGLELLERKVVIRDQVALPETEEKITLERDAKSQLTLERITDQKTTAEAETVYGERVLFLGENANAIGIISFCRFRDTHRIDANTNATNPSPTVKIVMRIEEETGSDFTLADPHLPDDISRKSYYETVASFADGSRDSRNIPPNTEPSYFILGGTVIPFHGIDKSDWENIKHILDIVSENETRAEDILHQANVIELLRRMRLIVEKGPNLDQDYGDHNTTSQTIRFG